MTQPHLIAKGIQDALAKAIARAVDQVRREFPNHGSEEGITPVLGHALMRQSFKSATLSVTFNYRQHHKQNEEPHSGADGGLLVRVSVPGETITKGALFQAKLLNGSSPVRQLKLAKKDAARLVGQSQKMISQTRESVVLFYTAQGIYVVDAAHYENLDVSRARIPLSEKLRLISLATYLGKWFPRCTRGDRNANLVSKIERPNAFKHGIVMDVKTILAPPIRWASDWPANRRKNY